MPEIDLTALAQLAASKVADQLPSLDELAVVPARPGQGPAAGSVAVKASFVGATAAELQIVADELVSQSLAGAGAKLSLAEALRPALEAGASVLGDGVLDDAIAADVDGDFPGTASTLFALVSGGEAVAWFAIRIQASTSPSGPRSDLRVLYGVELNLTVEIGRTKMPVRTVLDLAPGSVVELDRAAGAPADLMVNGRPIARGEIVVVDEEYGLRITEILAPEGGVL